MGTFDYTHRPIHVEAYQLPPEDTHTRAIPFWFMEAIRKGIIKANEDGTVDVALEAGPHTCNIGNWIVRFVNNQLEFMTDEEFNDVYEKSPESV